MKFHYFKIITSFFLFSFCLPLAMSAQNFKESKQRKKVMRKWSLKEKKNKTPYNPYLDKDTGKPTKKVSKEQTRENKKMVRKQLREIKREKRRLRRKKGAYKT